MSSLPLSSIINLASTVQNTLTGNKTSFTNHGTVDLNISAGQSFLFFVILIITMYLIMLLGTFVFNTSVVKIFPSVKKVSILDFFGLYIVLHLLLC